MVLKDGIMPIWGAVYLWENVKEDDPSVNKNMHDHYTGMMLPFCH